MNITVILVIALAITSTLGYAMFERANLYKERLDKADAVIAQHKKDMEDNRVAVLALTNAVGNIRNASGVIERTIYAAPRTDVCSKSDAMRAASDGVRKLLSDSPAPDRSKSAGSVPASGDGPR